MYDYISDKVYTAAESIQRLNENHERFVKALKENEEELPPVGKLDIEDRNIAITCLGVELHVHHRIVLTSDNLPGAIEYSFIVKHEDNDLRILDLYLCRNMELYKDLSENEDQRFCRFNHEYIVRLILNELAPRLLSSEIFAPSCENKNRS